MLQWLPLCFILGLDVSEPFSCFSCLVCLVEGLNGVDAEALGLEHL